MQDNYIKTEHKNNVSDVKTNQTVSKFNKITTD